MSDPPSALTRRLAVIALVIAAGTGTWWLRRRAGSGAAPSYHTEVVRRADVSSRVAATGTVKPVEQVQVGSQISGRIKELLVDYNDQVAAGQVLARIDPQLFASAVAQARARKVAASSQLARAEALAENARLQHQRVEGLRARGTVAQAELDTARAELRSAEAQVATARAEVTVAAAALQQAEVNLAYTTIRSPITGVVIARSVEVGQTVAASLATPTLFVIAGDLRKMEVHASVPEADVGQLRAAMPVEFTVDAYPDELFRGVVEEVRYEAQTVANVVTYDAVVSVDNHALRLRPGMTANAVFLVAQHRNVLVIPNKALRYRPRAAADEAGGGESARATAGAPTPPTRAAPAGGAPARARRRERVVWVLRAGSPVAVRVETGLSDGVNTEIVAGDLAVDERIITGDSSAATGPDRDRQRRGPPRIL